MVRKLVTLTMVTGLVLAGCTWPPATRAALPGAELLWMILDAAGEAGIGGPPFLARAVGTRLTADTLSQLLQARTLRTTQSGAEVSVTYGPDQTLSLSLNSAPLAEGCWWAGGDHYCRGLGPEFGGRQCCRSVLNGNQLTWFDLDGYASMTWEIERP